MIDHEQRKTLSQATRRLVTGRMSNDDFDDLYFDEFESSEDTAVKEIAGFCYGLYSSDTLLPYRLKGRHQVSSEVRQMTCRSVLFLRSDLEYEWPQFPRNDGGRFIQALAFNIGLPGSIVVLLLSLYLLVNRDGVFAVQIGLAAIGVLLTSVYLLFVFPRRESSSWRSWKDTGNWDAWPFVRQSDLDRQRKP